MTDTRRETAGTGHASRLDRELNELLQELRVVQGGVLLLIGFLLVIAFSPRFTEVTEFQKAVYFATLLVSGLAAIVVVAPVVHHRMAFRRRDKERVVVRGNHQVLASVVLVALSILGITVLITDFLYPGWLTLLVAVAYCVVVTVFWVWLPVSSIRRAMNGA